MKAFTRFDKHPDPRGKHRNHVFRIHVTKKGLGGPDQIIVWGDRAGIDEIKLKGKTKNRYVDIMVSGISQDIVPRLMQALADRYDRQGKIVAVFHLDEGKPHVHMLVPWVNEKGRALRLKRGERWRVRTLMAEITGHEITPTGQGRRRISTKRWEADPDTARRLALEMSEKDRTTLDQVKKIIDYYGGINVLATRSGGGTEIAQANVTAIAELRLKRLRLLNRSDYSIWFEAGGGKLSRVVFLDGVPREQLLCMPRNSLVIQTSGGRYQVHIRLDTELSETAMKAVRGWLAAKHEAGSDAGYHRTALLPGFFEQGHGEPVRIVKTTGCMPDLTYQDYLQELRVEQATTSHHHEALQRKKSGDYAAILESVKKGWHDFFSGDVSAADDSYVLYLLRHGVSEVDVGRLLICASGHIVTRKREALIPYVRRTVARAKENMHCQDARVQQAADPTAGIGTVCDESKT